MADENIDRLQIEIDASAEGAFQNLRKLKTELRSIKQISDDSGLSSIYNDLSNIASLDFSNLHDLATISANLGDIQSTLGGVTGAAQEAGAALGAIRAPDLTIDSAGINDAAAEVERQTGEIQAEARETANAVGADAQRAAREATAAARSTGNEVKKQTREISKETKKATSEASSGLGNLFSSIKRIVYYRAIRAAIKSVVSAFKTGIDDIYQYSKYFGLEFADTMDSLATEALYFKNSLGAIVAPLINAVGPAIIWVGDRLADLNNTIAMTIAMLRGQSTYTKAIKYNTEYAKSADKASKSAKDLKKSLASFDEIHIIGQNTNSNDSNKSADELDYSKMFEEANVEDSKLFGSLNKVVKKLNEIQKKFQAIGKNIKKAFDVNLSGTRIISSAKNIAETVGGFFEHIFDSTLEMLENVDFSGLTTSFTGLLESLDPVISKLSGIFTNLYDNVLMPIAQWTIEDALPASIDVLSAALNVVGSALEVVNVALDKLMPVLQPIIEFVEDTVVDLLSTLKDDLQAVADKIDEKMPVIEDAFEKLASVISKVWVVVGPILNALKWVIEKILDYLGFDLAYNVGVAIDQFDGLITFIDGSFNNDWDEAWSGIKKIFTSYWDNLPEEFKETIDKVVEKFQPLFDAFHDVGVLGKGAFKTLKLAWDESKFKKKIIDPVLEKVSEGWDKITETIQNDWQLVKLMFSGKFFQEDISEKIKEEFKGYINALIDGINKVITKPFEGLNSGIEKLRNFSIAGVHPFADLKDISVPQIPRLQNGGFPEGENGLFYANSAEIIGKFDNGRTAVANNNQITTGISNAVYAANSEQNSLLREQNKLLQQLLEKESGINVSTITKAQERMNRKHGKTIVPVGT